jgi:hypothetical protein
MAMKTAGISRNQMLSLVNSFLAHFQNLCNQKQAPTLADVEKYFAKTFQLNSNGKILARSSSDYLNRLNYLRQKYSQFEIIGPLEEPLIADNNHFTVHYELDLQGKDGKKRQVLLLANGIIEDNKVANWIQITHETGMAAHWDA